MIGSTCGTDRRGVHRRKGEWVFKDEQGRATEALANHIQAMQQRACETLILAATDAHVHLLKTLAAEGFEQVARGELTPDAMQAGLRAAEGESKRMLGLWGLIDLRALEAPTIDDLLAKREAGG